MKKLKYFYVFQLFRQWRLYLSKCDLRVEKHPEITHGQTRGNLGKRMRELRNTRYHQTGGCCEHCGKPFPKEAMQMHHILPYVTFPKFARQHYNVIMLCPRCHYIIHKDLMWQMDLIQKVAREHNVELRNHFRRSAENRWDDIVKLQDKALMKKGAESMV